MGQACDGVCQPTRLPQTTYQRFALCIDIMAMGLGNVGAGPLIKIPCKLRVLRIKKGPIQVLGITHGMPCSVTLKHRTLLHNKSVIRPLVVLGQHTNRLRLGLGFYRLVDRHRPLLVQHGFGHAVCKSGA